MHLPRCGRALNPALAQHQRWVKASGLVRVGQKFGRGAAEACDLDEVSSGNCHPPNLARDPQRHVIAMLELDWMVTLQLGWRVAASRLGALRRIHASAPPRVIPHTCVRQGSVNRTPAGRSRVAVLHRLRESHAPALSCEESAIQARRVRAPGARGRPPAPSPERQPRAQAPRPTLAQDRAKDQVGEARRRAGGGDREDPGGHDRAGHAPAHRLEPIGRADAHDRRADDVGRADGHPEV